MLEESMPGGTSHQVLNLDGSLKTNLTKIKQNYKPFILPSYIPWQSLQWAFDQGNHAPSKLTCRNSIPQPSEYECVWSWGLWIKENEINRMNFYRRRKLDRRIIAWGWREKEAVFPPKQERRVSQEAKHASALISESNTVRTWVSMVITTHHTELHHGHSSKLIESTNTAWYGVLHYYHVPRIVLCGLYIFNLFSV